MMMERLKEKKTKPRDGVMEGRIGEPIGSPEPEAEKKENLSLRILTKLVQGRKAREAVGFRWKNLKLREKTALLSEGYCKTKEEKDQAGILMRVGKERREWLL